MGDVNVGGVRNTILILKNVISSFVSFIKENKPDRLIFHARNDKRAKTYTKFGEDVVNKTGYKLLQKKDSSTGLIHFHLIKTEQLMNESLEFFKTL
jgi:hypothetical protein